MPGMSYRSGRIYNDRLCVDMKTRTILKFLPRVVRIYMILYEDDRCTVVPNTSRTPGTSISISWDSLKLPHNGSLSICTRNECCCCSSCYVRGYCTLFVWRYLPYLYGPQAAENLQGTRTTSISRWRLTIFVGVCLNRILFVLSINRSITSNFAFFLLYSNLCCCTPSGDWCCH